MLVVSCQLAEILSLASYTTIKHAGVDTRTSGASKVHRERSGQGKPVINWLFHIVLTPNLSVL